MVGLADDQELVRKEGENERDFGQEFVLGLGDIADDLGLGKNWVRGLLCRKRGAENRFASQMRVDEVGCEGVVVYHRDNRSHFCIGLVPADNDLGAGIEGGGGWLGRSWSERDGGRGSRTDWSGESLEEHRLYDVKTNFRHEVYYLPLSQVGHRGTV